ncbi:MAG TPA: phospho-N-acetylmuramoyl-pentapeptide-transferase [Fimbriimonadaceae bacterium]|nr:phospho-N-acetylmuramoyl-pentapeptide-transferase [Fimbriimonadaceae bacterium]HRJ95170.1 phospho-N-acetylmuramoyl-pentapeptide-transferase [Fimbriimonadaceae bacterium]
MSADEQKQVVSAFWVALGVSALAAWPIYRMLLALRSRQAVSEFAPETHQLKQGTPTMGGLIVLTGFPAGILLMAPSLPLVLLVVGFGVIGFLDDFVVPRLKVGSRGLGWKPKLLLQVFVATGALWLDPRFSDPLWLASGGFVILFFSNAYNFSDGLDGLAGTLGVMLCLGLGVVAAMAGVPSVAIASVALIGGLIPFLILNAPPARLFMGDVGSLPIGAAIGFMVFELARSPSMIPSLAVLSGILLVELIPVPLQIFWVKVFKKRLFSYTPIHHAFEKKGWPESRVVWTFGLVQFVLAAGAVSLAWLGGGAR